MSEHQRYENVQAGVNRGGELEEALRVAPGETPDLVSRPAGITPDRQRAAIGIERDPRRIYLHFLESEAVELEFGDHRGCAQEHNVDGAFGELVLGSLGDQGPGCRHAP